MACRVKTAMNVYWSWKKKVGEGYANTFTKSYHLAVAKHFGPDVPFQPCTKVLSQS